MISWFDTDLTCLQHCFKQNTRENNEICDGTQESSWGWHRWTNLKSQCKKSSEQISVKLYAKLKKHYKGTVCKILSKIYQVVFMQKFKKYLKTEKHWKTEMWTITPCWTSNPLSSIVISFIIKARGELKTIVLSYKRIPVNISWRRFDLTVSVSRGNSNLLRQKFEQIWSHPHCMPNYLCYFWKWARVPWQMRL